MSIYLSKPLLLFLNQKATCENRCFTCLVGFVPSLSCFIVCQCAYICSKVVHSIALLRTIMPYQPGFYSTIHLRSLSLLFLFFCPFCKGQQQLHTQQHCRTPSQQTNIFVLVVLYFLLLLNKPFYSAMNTAVYMSSQCCNALLS